MYDTFFTTYEITEPPPIQRKTYSRKFQNNIDKRNINLNDYPMVVTIDYPDLAETPAELDAQNPFLFQTEQLPTLEKPVETNTSPIATKIVDLARSFVGGKYVSGGKSPKQGFDCSGLISYVYKQNGIDLGRSTYEIFKAGREVQLSDAKVGDIICTPGSGRSGRHVKMISKIDDEGIHVVEAKGHKYGIVESVLNKTNDIITIRRIIDDSNQAPTLSETPSKTSVNGKFSSKSNFTQSLTSSYRRALLNNNMDPDWAPMLVASASIESAWGTKPSGSFNYGGVKVTDSQMRNGVSYTMRSTIDYVPGKGNIRREQPFRNFRSVDDYCNYMVRWLKSSKLYSSAFNKYSANQPMEAWEYILRAGYGGGSDSNIRKYIRWMGSRYNQIKQA